MKATPIKLKNGNWGAKCYGRVRAGDRLRITARSGKTWTASVAKVIWEGNGCSIVATASAPTRKQKLYYDQEDGMMKPWSECDMPIGG